MITHEVIKLFRWLILNNTDPMEELKWLVDILEKSEKNDEKVHVIGHIPAGNGDCLKIWQDNYYKIIRRWDARAHAHARTRTHTHPPFCFNSFVLLRFNDTVVAQFFGHTHTDEFELFYDEKDFDHPVGIAYVGPSVTTYTYLNPGYRIYYVDGDHESTTRVRPFCFTPSLPQYYHHYYY